MHIFWLDGALRSSNHSAGWISAKMPLVVGMMCRRFPYRVPAVWIYWPRRPGFGLPLTVKSQTVTSRWSRQHLNVHGICFWLRGHQNFVIGNSSSWRVAQNCISRYNTCSLTFQQCLTLRVQVFLFQITSGISSMLFCWLVRIISENGHTTTNERPNKNSIVLFDLLNDSP